ncbi:MAG: NADase-type glycan-binding domain-containing protein [Spirochaetota bacterium]
MQGISVGNRPLILAFVLLTVSGLSAPADEEACSGGELVSRTYHGRFQRVDFGCNELTHSDVRNPEGERERTVEYELVTRHKVPFIRLLDGSGEEWLALYGSRLLFLYDAQEKRRFLIGVNDGTGRSLEAIHFGPDFFSASSFLTEGDITYEAENLGTASLSKPWVEGVEGPGIGEEIRINQAFSRIWISTGYVSARRPELYTMNARPKTLLVVDVDTGEEVRVSLDDTPVIQALPVPGDRRGTRNLRLTIEEVYPGTRWEDTCVNFIIIF